MKNDPFLPRRVSEAADDRLAFLEFLFAHHPRFDGGADCFHRTVDFRPECRALRTVHPAHQDEDVVIAIGSRITPSAGAEEDHATDRASVRSEDLFPYASKDVRRCSIERFRLTHEAPDAGQLPRWNRPIHKNQFVFESVGIKAFESSQCDCLAPLRCPRLFSLLEPRLVLTDTCGEVRALDLDDENATAAHRMPRPCALADE